ncbi:MAG TPA: TIGR03086 family metal-binding protein [Chloroflexota bacterium]|nr:TIGR03086 family metal-binding protein [Chloroflexota bacterium]
MSDAIEQLRAALRQAQLVIERVEPDQLELPTPCEEWTVRQVINHLVTGNLMVSALVAEDPPPDRFADHLGTDYRNAFREGADILLDALQREGALCKMYETPVGRGPGSLLAEMRANEAVVHAWDIATATGQSLELDQELCEAALQGYSRFLNGRDRAQTAFNPERPAPPDATSAERLAAYLGRRVRSEG